MLKQCMQRIVGFGSYVQCCAVPIGKPQWGRNDRGETRPPDVLDECMLKMHDRGSISGDADVQCDRAFHFICVGTSSMVVCAGPYADTWNASWPVR